MGAVIRDPISGALAGVIRSYGKGAMWEQSELGEVPHSSIVETCFSWASQHLSLQVQYYELRFSESSTCLTFPVLFLGCMTWLCALFLVLYW